MRFSTLVIVAAWARLSIAGYVLEDDYSADKFFDMFDFFTGVDPTNGFVEFVDQNTATTSNMTSTASGIVHMGVDHTNETPNGRPSIRLTSKKSYDSGLVILDLAHMPAGCGTWPAFWMVGPSWPSNGEIDILEGVNEQTTNAMTLHTGPGCELTSGGYSGSLVTSNCDVDASGQATNAGCQITATSTKSFGAGFNSNNGGVFATQWTSAAINIFFFPRGSIPSDITSGSPDPTGWGTPTAAFKGSFVSSVFKGQQIVFDTTFCGDWAGNVWSSGSCASKASTCTSYVQNNPSAFANAYWSINSLKVYQQGTGGSSSSKLISASTAKSSVAASSVKSSVAASSVKSSVAASSAVVSTATVSTFGAPTSSKALSFPVSTPSSLSTFAVSTKSSAGSSAASAPESSAPFSAPVSAPASSAPASSPAPSAPASAPAPSSSSSDSDAPAVTTINVVTTVTVDTTVQITAPPTASPTTSPTPAPFSSWDWHGHQHPPRDSDKVRKRRARHLAQLKRGRHGALA